MKVTASPSPTTARAPIASGSDVVSASVSCPVAINAAPATIKVPRPVPVEQHARGYLRGGVHDHLQDDEGRQHARGSRAKRSAAFRPDTPSVVRSSTATM